MTKLQFIRKMRRTRASVCVCVWHMAFKGINEKAMAMKPLFLETVCSAECIQCAVTSALSSLRIDLFEEMCEGNKMLFSLPKGQTLQTSL